MIQKRIRQFIYFYRYNYDMLQHPFVSAILPAYNGATYLTEAIESVLHQTYSEIELIVVNDGSTDDSAKIIQSYPGIIYIQQSNQGVPFARNAGVEVAQGEFLCFIDQDDVWLPEKTRLQVDAHKRNPDIGYSITTQVFYLSSGVERPGWCPEEWLDRPIAGFSPSTLMIKRTLFNEMKQFDTNFPVGSDTDLFFRLKDNRVPFYQLQQILVRKRVHLTNQSATQVLLRRDIMETVRRSIQRQRSQIKES